ncbi:MAG: hypothetical protein JXB36_14870 [Gammaproteobacteria bacterium]|nr:hypothetical protein [Gammaproteobacteria bacterium]
MHHFELVTFRAFARAAFRRGALLSALVALLAAGCGSGSGGSGAPPPPPSSPGGGSNGGGNGGGNPALEATFQSIQDNVFTPICTACHAGASAPLGLRLDEDNSYGLLVGVASVQQPDLQRVEPGNPDDSYLIHKLEGTAAVGGRMPLNGTPLPQADIDVIRQWITDGAQDATPAEPPAAPIKVSSLSPLPDSTMTELPANVTAMFDRDPDAATVNAETFLLERSGGDGTFDDGNEVAVAAASIDVPAENPQTAVLDLAGVDSVDDVYRVRLLGAGASMILDLDANALDGEFAGTFPSGDGTAGGDFEATFVVSSVEPTLLSIQENVFTPICSACHNGPESDALPTGLDLSDADASFANLVSRPSVQVAALDRVEPGNPDDSYLIHKLEGTAEVGERMPFGQPPLEAATIAAIRQWIADGAAE